MSVAKGQAEDGYLNTPEPPDTLTELVIVLAALAAFLTFYKERRWSLRLCNDLALLRLGDPHGLETLLTDVAKDSDIPWANLLIAPETGPISASGDTKEIRKRLENLRAEVQRRAFILHTEAYIKTCT